MKNRNNPAHVNQAQQQKTPNHPKGDVTPGADASIDPKKIRRVGENIGQPEPDAVDIDPREGNTVDETWHRAGGKSSGQG